MNGHVSDDPFIKEITREMDYIKSDSKREAKYMSYWKEQADLMDMKREARAEGRAEGRTEGRTEGENRLNELNRRLLEEGRIEELKKATVDKAYRDMLYDKYGIGLTV